LVVEEGVTIEGEETQILNAHVATEETVIEEASKNENEIDEAAIDDSVSHSEHEASVVSVANEVDGLEDSVVTDEAAVSESVGEGHSTAAGSEHGSGLQRTLALIKPDAYGAGHLEAIKEHIIAAGFHIVREKQVKLTLEMTQQFYKEHEGKPFYEDLTTWMSR
jgi:hypothetical protein